MSWLVSVVIPSQIGVHYRPKVNRTPRRRASHTKRMRSPTPDQALTAPDVKPWMNSRCMNAKSTSSGMIATSVPAICSP